MKSWPALLLAGLLAACASPSPAPVLMTLPSVAAPLASTAPAASASAPLLAVRRVNIPEYLVSRRVRYRADASTLAEWPNTFWAERIEIGVSREFVSALRQQLPGWSLCDTNCGDAAPVLSLQVDLVPMDFVRSAGRLQARARIVVSTGTVPPRALKTLDLNYDLPASGDTAQAHAQAIGELIRQVAQAATPLVNSAPR
ncbi:MAG: ABC-type transport auxiliary lipoprotein family protein [Burkholderiaceae bacterium]